MFFLTILVVLDWFHASSPLLMYHLSTSISVSQFIYNLNGISYQHSQVSICCREESPFPARHVGVAGGVRPLVVVPHGPAATGETIAKEIHQRMVGRQQQQIRDELFGSDVSETSGWCLNLSLKRNLFPILSNHTIYVELLMHWKAKYKKKLACFLRLPWQWSEPRILWLFVYFFSQATH